MGLDKHLHEIDINVFPGEYKRLRDIIDSIELQYGTDNTNMQHIDELVCEYAKLLKQTAKIVRISDNNQQKLRNARQKLETQNQVISVKNQELNRANEKILLELKRAAEYVRSIIPEPAAFDSHNLKIDWSFIPSLHLGGDLLGFKQLDSEHFALYLLDVCGHGVRSALYSVSVVNTINNAHMTGIDYRDPGELLNALNQQYQMKDHDNLYFTIWYGVYNHKSKILNYCAAGHPPAFLLDQNLALTQLGSDNFFIGIIKDTHYKSEQVEIVPPANLMIYSDGAYEIPIDGDEMMTINQFADFIYESFKANEDIKDIYDKLVKLYDNNPLDDDFSILKASFRQ
ncbi:MAG: SpoIIE family protein phosphatase [Desulfobulbaceae bacterium]|nr:SpoIIE family protein phosphatase [Desulfobulbaceae bacterium]